LAGEPRVVRLASGAVDELDRAHVRLAELVAALSLGIDLGFGQPMEGRSRYDWSQPGVVKQTVLDSNAGRTPLRMGATGVAAGGQRQRCGGDSRPPLPAQSRRALRRRAQPPRGTARVQVFLRRALKAVEQELAAAGHAAQNVGSPVAAG
jgi:hypothetical protein